MDLPKNVYNYTGILKTWNGCRTTSLRKEANSRPRYIVTGPECSALSEEWEQDSKPSSQSRQCQMLMTLHQNKDLAKC